MESALGQELGWSEQREAAVCIGERPIRAEWAVIWLRLR